MSRIRDLHAIAREAVETDTPLLTRKAFDAGVDGYSGDRLIGFLQRAAAYYQDDPDADALAYLEVGVYRGLTLMNVAAAAPRLRVYGCDNFSQFDPSGENRSVVEGHIKTLGVGDTVRLIEADFEPLLADGDGTIEGRKLAVYFFDGPHDYRSQLIGLLWAARYMAPGGMMIIDDCNYAQVRQATYDFLKGNPAYTLLLEAYTASHPKAGSREHEDECRRTWWNGLHVIVHDPDGELSRHAPPFSPGVQNFHRSLHPHYGMINGGHATTGAELRTQGAPEPKA